MDETLENFLKRTGWSCDDLLQKINQYKQVKQTDEEGETREKVLVITDDSVVDSTGENLVISNENTNDVNYESENSAELVEHARIEQAESESLREVYVCEDAQNNVDSDKGSPKVEDVVKPCDNTNTENEAETAEETQVDMDESSMEDVRNSLKLQLSSLRNRKKKHILHPLTTKVVEDDSENRKPISNTKFLSNTNSNNKTDINKDNIEVKNDNVENSNISTDEKDCISQTNELGLVILNVEGGVDFEEPEAKNDESNSKNIDLNTKKLEPENIAQTSPKKCKDAFAELRRIIQKPRSTELTSKTADTISAKSNGETSPKFITIRSNILLNVTSPIPSSSKHNGSSEPSKPQNEICSDKQKTLDKDTYSPFATKDLSKPQNKITSYSKETQDKNTYSPFVSNELDAFLTANSQLRISYSIPKSGAEAGLSETSRAESPKTVQAASEEYISRPKTEKDSNVPRIKAKTLAEKRKLLELQTNNKTEYTTEVIQLIIEEDKQVKDVSIVKRVEPEVKKKNEPTSILKKGIVKTPSQSPPKRMKTSDTKKDNLEKLLKQKSKSMPETKENLNKTKASLASSPLNKAHSKNENNKKITPKYKGVDSRTLSVTEEKTPPRRYPSFEETKSRSLLKVNRIGAEPLRIKFKPLTKKGYVMYNDAKIYVACSSEDLICNIKDSPRQPVVKKPEIKQKPKTPKKPSLWHHTVEYKPGPLSKKVKLAKNSQGDLQIELKKLPTPILEIVPQFGKPISPKIVHLLPKNNGKISEFQLEFALSAVVPKKDSKPVLTIFGLKLPYAKNVDTVLVHKLATPKIISSDSPVPIKDTKDRNTVKSVVEDLITYLETKEIEESLIKEDPDLPTTTDKTEKLTSPTSSTSKKVRRNRMFCELQRLSCKVVDVDTNLEDALSKCNNESCRLGCVCQSLKCDFSVRNRCDKVKCMFECSCPDKNIKTYEPDYSTEPGKAGLSSDTVHQIEEKAKKNMAKVEKDFTHTVIYTSNKAIVIGAEDKLKPKRVTKAPKKYVDFVSSDGENPISSDVISNPYKGLETFTCSVITKRLSLPGVVPWCMIHLKYDCPCISQQIESLPNKERKSYTFTYAIPACARLISADRYTKRNKAPRYFDRLTRMIKRAPGAERYEVTDSDRLKLKHYEEDKDGDYTDAELLKFEIIQNAQKEATEKKAPPKRKHVNEDADVKVIQRRKKIKRNSIIPPERAPVFKGEIIIDGSNMELSKHLATFNLRFARLLPWTNLLELYKQNEIRMWSTYPDLQRLFINKADQPIPCEGIDVRIRTPSIALCTWLKQGFLPSNYDPGNTSFILKNYKDHFEVRGICNRQTDPPAQEVKLSKKIEHVNKEGKVKILNLIMHEYPPRKVAFFNDNNEEILEPQSVRLNKISNSYRWRVFLLNSNFTYLHFKSIGYSIRYTALHRVLEKAKEQQLTVSITNSEIAEGHVQNFGIHFSPDQENRFFVGPYKMDEDHDIETLRYLSKCLIDTDSYNQIYGDKNTQHNFFWAKNCNSPSTESEGDIIDLTSDDAEKENTKDLAQNYFTILEMEPKSPKDYNHFFITNIPDFGYLGACLNDDTGVIDVSWPFEKKVLRFLNVDRAVAFLESHYSAMLNRIPIEFEIKFKLLSEIDLDKHKPINPAQLNGYHICGTFGVLNAKEIQRSEFEKKCGQSAEYVLRVLAERAQRIVLRHINEFAKQLGMSRDDVNYTSIIEVLDKGFHQAKTELQNQEAMGETLEKEITLLKEKNINLLKQVKDLMQQKCTDLVTELRNQEQIDKKLEREVSVLKKKNTTLKKQAQKLMKRNYSDTPSEVSDEVLTDDSTATSDNMKEKTTKNLIKVHENRVLNIKPFLPQINSNSSDVAEEDEEAEENKESEEDRVITSDQDHSEESFSEHLSPTNLPFKIKETYTEILSNPNDEADEDVCIISSDQDPEEESFTEHIPPHNLPFKIESIYTELSTASDDEAKEESSALTSDQDQPNNIITNQPDLPFKIDKIFTQTSSDEPIKDGFPIMSEKLKSVFNTATLTPITTTKILQNPPKENLSKSFKNSFLLNNEVIIFPEPIDDSLKPSQLEPNSCLNQNPPKEDFSKSFSKSLLLNNQVTIMPEPVQDFSKPTQLETSSFLNQLKPSKAPLTITPSKSPQNYLAHTSQPTFSGKMKSILKPVGSQPTTSSAKPAEDCVNKSTTDLLGIPPGKLLQGKIVKSASGQLLLLTKKKKSSPNK